MLIKLSKTKSKTNLILPKLRYKKLLVVSGTISLITGLTLAYFNFPAAADEINSTDFVTTWRTTVANESITIPTNNTLYTYNYNLDCNNDGIPEQTDLTANAYCVFDVPGDHKVRVSGVFPYFAGADGPYGNNKKLAAIDQWGSQKWLSMKNSFMSHSNVEVLAQDVPDLSLATDVSGVFYDASSVGKDGSTGNWNWDTSSITNMSQMFYLATSFNQPIGSWDTSNVVGVISMFQGASTFNQPIGDWDTTNVTDMSGMFTGASSFNSPIGDWNTSSVTNMSSMFADASTFNQPIGTWNTSSVTSMSYIFSSAASFNQPINTYTDAGGVHWDVSNVVDMSRVFYHAPAFNQPIDKWDTSNVTNMNAMFLQATAFNQPIGNWDTGKVKDMSMMFIRMGGDALAFNQDISAWNVSSVTNFMLFMADYPGGATAFSTTNYDKLLISWKDKINTTASPFGIQSYYCEGESARADLISRGFNITGDLGKNCPPSDITLSSTTVAEGQTAAGTISATIDNDATANFSLVTGEGSDDNHLFTLTNTGDLSFNSIPSLANPLDANQDNTYTIRVRVTDSAPLPAQFTEQVFQITLTNKLDTDKDGIPDETELLYGTDPTDPNSIPRTSVNVQDEAPSTNNPILANASLEITNGLCNNIQSIASLPVDNLTAPEANVKLLSGITFQLTCGELGGSATANFTLGTTYNDSDLAKLRIYKQDNNQLIDITNQVSLTNQNNQTILSYQLTDGKTLDEDNLTNAKILDPVYIGILTDATTNNNLLDTGASLAPAILAAGVMVVGGVVSARRSLRKS